MTEADHKPKRLSPVKWVLGVLGLVAVMVICGGLPFYLRDGGPPVAPGPIPPINVVIVSMLGIVAVAFGMLFYGVMLLTACLTFRFRKPFFKAHKIRFWIANLIVGLFVQVGFSLIVMPYLSRLLARALPPQVALLVGFFAPYVVMQILLIWFTIWAPLERIVIARRLRALGVTPQQMTGGWHMGLSDANKSSFKKFPMVEEDVGMMWLEPQRIVYVGDTRALDVPHAQLHAVERQADAGAISSYFGAVHVIIRFVDEQGVERRVRLHPEGDWTMTAKARALNAIADRLTAWKENPTPGWLRDASGFAVIHAGAGSGAGGN